MDCHIFLKHMPSTIFANNNDQEDNSCVCYKEQSHRPSNHMQKCIGFLEMLMQAQKILPSGIFPGPSKNATEKEDYTRSEFTFFRQGK